jgi:hypothetical protein
MIRNLTALSDPAFTGKLCRRALVLIWWQVGADKAVSEHVVWALEVAVQVRY